MTAESIGKVKQNNHFKEGTGEQLFPLCPHNGQYKGGHPTVNLMLGDCLKLMKSKNFFSIAVKRIEDAEEHFAREEAQLSLFDES